MNESRSAYATESSAGALDATFWPPDTAPTPLRGERPAEAGVVWIDLDGELPETKALRERLEPLCAGIEDQMLTDLLAVEEFPEERWYANGAVRLVTTFHVTAETLTDDTGRERHRIEIHPVELLAGEGWLVSRWHPKRIYADGELVEQRVEEKPDGLVEGVIRRWRAGTGDGAGDLGILVMHELSLGYAPAWRRLFHWLEEWELALYGEAGESRAEGDTLRGLWRSMALLRDWVSPLNKIGIRQDIGLAWLPATDHGEVIALDDRFDMALSSLRELASTMRASFNLLHVQLAEEQRARTERTQRQVGFLATVILVPTLIVGFYGANTYVPGEGERWGMWVMVAALIALTSAALVGLHLWHRRQERRDADSRRSGRRP